MVICSSMGNATTTEPLQGFQDKKLARVFAPQTVFNTNKTTPINETTPVNTTTPVTTLPPNNHSQNQVPVVAIAAGVTGGFLFLIAVFFFLRIRRRNRMVTLIQVSEMSASTETQELKECGLHEFHDSRNVPELPASVPELYSSSLKSERLSSTVEPLNNTTTVTNQ